MYFYFQITPKVLIDFNGQENLNYTTMKLGKCFMPLPKTINIFISRILTEKDNILRTYLILVKTCSKLHQAMCVIISSPAVQDISQVHFRNISVLVWSRVDCSPETLNTMIVITNDSPVQASYVEQYPFWSNILETNSKT